jgi:hypothetical protein
MAQQPRIAVIQPIPWNDPDAALEHVMEHVIGLDMQVKLDRILINVGVHNANELLLKDTNGLTDGLTANTSELCKMRIKAMRRWAEEQQDTFSKVDIADFTTAICKEPQ